LEINLTKFFEMEFAMLVLSRRVAEQICIPELGITLEVISIKGNTVRLGIDAPPEIRILRSELLDQRESGSPSPLPLKRFLEKKPSSAVVNESRVGYLTRTSSHSRTSNGTVAV
jgi:carbon storage regulator